MVELQQQQQQRGASNVTTADEENQREKPNYAFIKPRVSKDFKDPRRRARAKANNSLSNGNSSSAVGNNGSNAFLAGAPIIEPVIRFKTNFHNTIHDTMTQRGWKQTESEMDWDFHWAEREWMFEVFDYAHLETWQRVNHFRNDRELCRKDLLIKNIKRTRRILEREKNVKAEEYNFCPTTYVLPGEYALFVEEFKRNANNTTWIMKPIGKSQGRGIFLFQKLSQISKWRSESKWKPENPDIDAYVVQKYIANPLLIGGKKFDLRVYALVTSFQPLTVYMYRSGFARFSAARYSAHSSDMSNQVVHLTNIAIQKAADNYNQTTGSKWDLRALKLYLASLHGPDQVDTIFKAIEDIVVLSLSSVQKVMINDKHCFELYGYDVMIDEDLKPWLIEVNAAPSLSANTKDDYKLKCRMLSDLLDVVDMERTRTPEDSNTPPLPMPNQQGGFDLIFLEQDMRETLRKTDAIKSRLGCAVPPRTARKNAAAVAAAAAAASTNQEEQEDGQSRTMLERGDGKDGNGVVAFESREISTGGDRNNGGSGTLNAEDASAARSSARRLGPTSRRAGSVDDGNVASAEKEACARARARARARIRKRRNCLQGEDEEE